MLFRSRTRFGDTDPEKFTDSQIPKYETINGTTKGWEITYNNQTDQLVTQVTEGIPYFLAPGQQLFTNTGNNSWVVPPGITEISGACISGGASGEGSQSSSGGQGGAGGSGAYQNNIPVTPGETLTIHVGVGASAMGGYNNQPNGNDGGPSGIREDLMLFDRDRKSVV